MKTKSDFLNKEETIQWIIDNKKIINSKGVPETNLKILKKRALDAFHNIFDIYSKNKDTENKVKKTKEGAKYIHISLLEKKQFRKPRVTKKKEKVIFTLKEENEITIEDWSKDLSKSLPESIRKVYINTALKNNTTLQDIFLRILINRGNDALKEVINDACFKNI